MAGIRDLLDSLQEQTQLASSLFYAPICAFLEAYVSGMREDVDYEGFGFTAESSDDVEEVTFSIRAARTGDLKDLVSIEFSKIDPGRTSEIHADDVESSIETGDSEVNDFLEALVQTLGDLGTFYQVPQTDGNYYVVWKSNKSNVFGLVAVAKLDEPVVADAVCFEAGNTLRFLEEIEE